MTVGIEEAMLPEEQLISRTFTDEDRELLRSYDGLIDGLAELFGKHCEVVLHSLENLHESVIKIANGFNTGRPEGASGIEAVGDLDHRLVQIFQGVEHHFTMLAEQLGQAIDEPIV